MRSRSTLAPTGRELVLRTIAEHAASLLATARRHSLCADDAQDAYQRALEIFLRRADDISPERATGWLRTVVRHEALAVRRSRLRLVGPEANDMDLEEARELTPSDERAISFERLERSAEVLGGLKPQEVRALVLKAHGYSYAEICEMTGWSYTKVNRCLSEGRRAFRARLDDIEHGRECRRWELVLSAAADGEAAPGDLAAARPHLRHCAACRSVLRDHRLTGRGIAVVLPLAAVAGPPTAIEQAPGLLVRAYEAIAGGVHERAAASAQKLTAEPAPRVRADRGGRRRGPGRGGERERGRDTSHEPGDGEEFVPSGFDPPEPPPLPPSSAPGAAAPDDVAAEAAPAPVAAPSPSSTSNLTEFGP